MRPGSPFCFASFYTLLITSEDNLENHALVELFIWKVTWILNMIGKNNKFYMIAMAPKFKASCNEQS
jgi:hypothetical protein